MLVVFAAEVSSRVSFQALPCRLPAVFGRVVPPVAAGGYKAVMMSYFLPPVQMSQMAAQGFSAAPAISAPQVISVDSLRNRARWAPLLLSAFLLLMCGCQSPLHRVHLDHPSMGTRFQITVFHSDRDHAQEWVRTAWNRIDQIDQACSDWKESSELRQLCRAAPHLKPVVVSTDLLQVMQKALAIARVSEGAFDPTVGGLVRLWRRCHRAGRLPRDHEVEKARKGMGIDGIIIDEAASTIQLLREGVAIDLGGIAKGHAVQEVFQLLERQGIRHLIIDGGGDLVLGDPPPGRRGWQIAIGASNPQDPSNGTPLKLLIPGRAAVATSGDATRFTEIEGRRYSHILDPSSGLGIEGPHQVTVISTDGAIADALATAISLLEPQAASDLLQRFPGSAALLVDPRDGSHQVLGELPLATEQ